MNGIELVKPMGPTRGRSRIVVGLMSGTSADGIDAACVAVTGRGRRMRVRLLAHLHRPFPAGLRRRILAVMAPALTTTQEIARLHAELGEAFAEAAGKAIAALPADAKPCLIGLAGQTVCHLPSRRSYHTVTLQLGEAARVAARTGVAVVSDFRQSDAAAGGQGAPLVPWTDWILFRHPRRHRIVLNLGGIGNLTWLPAGGGPEQILAFDTGPGNMLIDGLVSHLTGGREHCDRDGRRASRGRILSDVLASWMRHPFLRQRPPRTTGREEFGRPFIASQLPVLRRASRRSDDWVATATAYTAACVADAFRRFLRPGLEAMVVRRRRNRPQDQVGRYGSADVQMIVGGGGARNPTLMGAIAGCLPDVEVTAMDQLGIPAEAKEAVSFAILAAAFADRTPGNLPQVTGAAHPAILGRWCPPP